MIEPGQSFDRAAEEYERGRPGYPVELLDLVDLPPTATVLDLGAGTGKLTRVLPRRYRRVLAVEPLPEMRSILEREVPEAETHEGTAEAIPLPDASVDGVFAGQAFHWFANRHAVAEIARVLRPGGLFVAVWNERSDLRPSPLPDAYRRRFDALQPPAPPTIEWAKVIEAGPFGPLESASVEHEQVSDRDAILRFAASVSFIARRDDRRDVVAGLAELLPGGEYRFPLRTDVNWARRL